MGDERIDALKNVDAEIERGEFVALVGSSGSGKSTLMNILGCLDTPTSGKYLFAGQDVSGLDENALADLRRKNFGFVFQRYHLLDSLDALSNVEVPAIYAGTSKSRRVGRARELLARLGLLDRIGHRPSEMSGGQQQRVSIARALMNGGHIILADEPTGALDSKTGASVLALLKSLHMQGHTIIMVTHDPAVAQHADRVIEIHDGAIASDKGCSTAPLAPSDRPLFHESSPSFFVGMVRRVSEATSIAFHSIAAHRLRSALTLFGIVVGIVAIIAVVGLGEGAQRIVLDQINSLGANSISIMPGTGWDDENANKIDTLTPGDASAVSAQSYVDSVSPLVKDTGSLSFDNRTVTGVINGVGNAYFEVAQMPIAQGTRFSGSGEQPLQEALIESNAKRTFFGDAENPLGQIIVVKGVPFIVVGVIEELGGSLAMDKRPQVFVPYKSVSARISGSERLSEIVVRVHPEIGTDVAEQALIALLEKRHGKRDFFTFNSDQLRRTIQTTTRALSLLVLAIGAVALVVGGVGVMNIMLVSITERTNEIGLRMAVGARPGDIMLQFLIEALVITAIGCAVAIALAYGLAKVSGSLGTPIPLIISFKAVAVGCLMASLVGAIFGFFPARKAARLNPVDALTRH